MQFLIIRKHFSLKCGEACSPFCFSTPLVPIKAVFLQRILSWWRQPLRALEVKSHRTCMADGLCKRMCKKRKQQRKKQTSIKLAACLHWGVPIFYPIWDLHFEIFKLFLKNPVKPAGDQGKHKILFCGQFSSQDLLKTIRTTLVFLVGAAWSQCFDQLSQLNRNKLCSGPASTKAETVESQWTEDSA